MKRKLPLTHSMLLPDQSCQECSLSYLNLPSTETAATAFVLCKTTEHSNAHSQQTTSSHPHFGPRLLLHIFSKIQGEECSSRNYSSNCCLQNIAMHKLTESSFTPIHRKPTNSWRGWRPFPKFVLHRFYQNLLNPPPAPPPPVSPVPPAPTQKIQTTSPRTQFGSCIFFQIKGEKCSS